jgi:hypothetical protein
MHLADKLRLRQSLARFAVITLVCLSVTAPAVLLSPALPYFKVEQLLLPVLLGAYVWLLLAGLARPIRLTGMFLVGLLYCLWNALSLWYGAEILGHTVAFRDFYELPKVWLPVLFFTIAYEAHLSESSLRRLIGVFSFAILFVCAYAWGQFFDLGFTHQLNSYYSSGGHIDTALEFARRAYATAGNSNILGELMTWCFVLFLLAALFRAGSRLGNTLVAIACLVTVVMTGSRYGLLTITLALLLIFGLALSGQRRGRAQIAMLLLLLPLFAWTYETVATRNRRTLERYETLSNPLQIDSLRGRVDDVWPESWADFVRSPLIGNGVSKTYFDRGERVVDSEYLGVLREQGVFGLAIYLGYFLVPLHLIRKGQRLAPASRLAVAKVAPATLAAIHASFLMGILALVMNIGMGTFYVPFVQAFLWLWLGIGARAAYSVCHPHRAPAIAPARNQLLLPQKA